LSWISLSLHVTALSSFTSVDGTSTENGSRELWWHRVLIPGRCLPSDERNIKEVHPATVKILGPTSFGNTTPNHNPA
jgi:hypothetical protein